MTKQRKLTPKQAHVLNVCASSGGKPRYLAPEYRRTADSLVKRGLLRRGVTGSGVNYAVLEPTPTQELFEMATRAAPAVGSFEHETARVRAALATFPAVFGLRAFPGKRFVISESASMFCGEGLVYVALENGGAFAKGTPAELRAGVVELPGSDEPCTCGHPACAKCRAQRAAAQRAAVTEADWQRANGGPDLRDEEEKPAAAPAPAPVAPRFTHAELMQLFTAAAQYIENHDGEPLEPSAESASGKLDAYVAAAAVEGTYVESIDNPQPARAIADGPQLVRSPKAAKRPRLTLGQVKTLERLENFPQGEESPFGLGRDTATAVSAWHRTMTSLIHHKLVTRKRYGDHYKAWITAQGLEWLAGGKPFAPFVPGPEILGTVEYESRTRIAVEVTEGETLDLLYALETLREDFRRQSSDPTQANVAEHCKRRVVELEALSEKIRIVARAEGWVGSHDDEADDSDRDA